MDPLISGEPLLSTPELTINRCENPIDFRIAVLICVLVGAMRQDPDFVEYDIGSRLSQAFEATPSL
jgi:hypothetical protein